ncbi:sodium:proton antiporter [Agromyces sp. CFH 90414]|uniref:Sodium:proton antiporter n=1 Tax=Agromyces agglutinans TaxID=2662258 RepID=A0A6I2F9Y9_9MICO|nr:DUF6328 family protein [Agromyces agglutinans]MRG59176.1 sodium:proton antiporter [Agromyces agglutinans]
MTAAPGPRHAEPDDADADLDADPADGRDETPVEKADRNWGDILQELRAVQTGTQIITGFLLAVAFQPKFADLEPYEVGLYLVLVVLAGFATVLGLAPVIMHRRLFGQRQKPTLVRQANRLLIALLVVVSLLAAGVTSLIFDVAVNRTAGFVALGVALVVVIVFWTVVPRVGRRRG